MKKDTSAKTLINSNGAVHFIALAGVDGSGKSTQVEPLMEYYLQAGHKVAYFHAIEFSLANRLSRLFKKEKGFEPGKEKAVTKSSLLSLFLREKFLFVDFIRFQFWRRHLRLLGYDMILSDRSFYDSLINIEYLNLEHNSSLVRFGLWVLSLLLPQADTVFFFDLTPEDIMTRSRVPEQGEDYLRDKLTLFRLKKDSWHLISIDATESKEIVLEKLKGNILL